MPSLVTSIVEFINDQNLFTELNLANWFSSYVQLNAYMLSTMKTGSHTQKLEFG